MGIDCFKALNHALKFLVFAIQELLLPKSFKVFLLFYITYIWQQFPKPIKNPLFFLMCVGQEKQFALCIVDE